jgi:antitoxin (DNA-binding transcriptional repressor) of toxin-antitoxin stability system
MKTKIAQMTLVAATLLASPALVMAQAPAANAVVVDAAITDNIFQLYEGTVTKIDKKTRTIFFKNNEGESKFIAGPEIKSFDQIKVGDRLNVTYELAVAIELIKTKSDGVRSKVETASEVTSKPGEKPTRTITNTTTIIADIIAVDRAKKLVSVKGPSGKVTIVTVKNPQLLADVNVGEQVRVIYFDAMAASITPTKKK